MVSGRKKEDLAPLRGSVPFVPFASRKKQQGLHKRKVKSAKMLIMGTRTNFDPEGVSSRRNGGAKP